MWNILAKVSSQGVRMDPTEVLAVLKWLMPTNLLGLCEFLGLTGYHSRFIREYVKIAAPLTSFLKKDVPQPWHWTEEAYTTFNELKSALTSTPLSCMPDFS